MKPEDLINRIYNEYRKARKPLIPSKRIRRGTNRGISSITEDLIAAYMDHRANNDHELWIDPQITVDGLRNTSGKRPLLFRPDICIFNAKDQTIKAIFDIKMDLGRVRDFIPYVKDGIVKVEKIRKLKGKCDSVFGTKEKPDGDFNFSPLLKWIYVVVSKGNIRSDKYEKIVQFIKKNENKVSMFTLVEGHLNQDEESPSKKEFSRLDRKLKQIFKS